MPDPLLDTTTRTGTDDSHTLMDIKVTVMIIHREVIPDHITDATTEALLDTVIQALITISVKCHTGDHPHIKVYQPTP